jgi:hypothetical protein
VALGDDLVAGAPTGADAVADVAAVVGMAAGANASSAMAVTNTIRRRALVTMPDIIRRNDES